MQITRIKPDSNGNSRRVVHFLEFLTPADRTANLTTTALYDLALKRARKLGGRKYHNRQYGGGIVFQAYSDEEVRCLVDRALASA